MLSTGLRSVLKQALTKPRLNKIKTSEVAETLPKPKVEEDLVFTPIKKVEETGDAASALAKEIGIDRDEILKAADIQAKRTEIRSPKILREAAEAIKAAKNIKSCESNESSETDKSSEGGKSSKGNESNKNNVLGRTKKL